MTTYTYAATDLITGTVLADEIPLDVQSFTTQLNGGGSLSGSLTLRQPFAQNSAFVEALECRRAVIWALADGYPVWNGVVWDWPDTTRANGTLPISAQTLDSVWSHRLITATLQYRVVDIFQVFIDLVRYGTTKASSYITALSPIQGPASALVGAAAAVSGLILPTGAAALSGTTWSASYMYSDLSVIADEFNNLVSAGNLEYIFQPGFDSSGNLATYLRLGYTTLGRSLPQAGYSLTYPGNVSDYGYQRTGSQSTNYVWATAPPNGAPVSWESLYPHGVDLDDLQAGYPLMETTVSWQGSIVTKQAQVNTFADGQMALKSRAMTLPVITIAGGSYPKVTDLVIGDTVQFAATSDLHPAGANNAPGITQLVRLIGWTVTPSGPNQSESVQLATSAVLAPPS